MAVIIDEITAQVVSEPAPRGVGETRPAAAATPASTVRKVAGELDLKAERLARVRAD